MKYLVCTVFLLCTITGMGAQNAATAGVFDINAAERFANLALACVHKEYPNKISHNLNSDADVAPPRKLTPAFYAATTGTLRYTGIGCWRGSLGLFPMLPSRRLHAKPCGKA